MHVFLDDADLSATPSLWPSIESAVRGSRFFLLLASPAAAQSKWVVRELESWFEEHSIDNLLLVLTEGELDWDHAAADFNWGGTDSLPSILTGRFSSEPRYVDLRWAKGKGDLSLRNSKFRSAVADLASVVRDIPKDLLEGEDIRQFRRSRRLAYSAAIGLILTVCTLAASLVELQKARMAKKQQQLMEKSARHRSYLANVLAADIALNAGKTEDAARHLSASAFEREAWEW